MTLLLARNLEVADYGAFAFVSTWLMFFVIVSVGGLDTAAMRYVAQFAEEQNAAEKTANFVRWARRRVLVGGCVVAAVVCAVLVVSGVRRSQLNPSLIYVAAVVLPLLSLVQLQQFVLRARREIGRADLIGQIIRPLVVIVIVAIAVSKAMQLSEVHAMLAVLVGTGISVIVGEYRLRHTVFTVEAAPDTQAEFRLWARTARPMLLITGSHFLLHQLDILMLGSIAGTSHVAPYAVASRLADLVVFSLIVASGIVAPLISSLFHSGRSDELREILRMSGRWVSLAAFFVAVILFVGREPVLRIFGPEYVSAGVILMILIIGQLMNAIAGPVGYLLTMTGNQQGSAKILGAGVLVNVVLNAILIPVYYELGAAIATVVTAVFWNACMTIYANRKLGIRATPI